MASTVQQGHHVLEIPGSYAEDAPPPTSDTSRTSPGGKTGQRSGSRAGTVAPQWLKAGMQAEVNELAIYVDAICAAKASKDHHQEREALIAQTRMLEARIKEQDQELDHLRRILPSQDGSFRGLYLEMRALKEDMVSWRSKFHKEQECRAAAESTMQEAVRVVEEMELQFDAISAGFTELHALSKAEAAEACAKSESKGWMQTYGWRGASLVIVAVLGTLVATIVATFYVARLLLLR